MDPRPTTQIAVVASADATVGGEVDAASVGGLMELVRRLPFGDRHLDASTVSFAGAAAIGALIRLSDETEALGGHLTIAPSSAIRRVAALVGVDQTLGFV